MRIYCHQWSGKCPHAPGSYGLDAKYFYIAHVLESQRRVNRNRILEPICYFIRIQNRFKKITNPGLKLDFFGFKMAGGVKLFARHAQYRISILSKLKIQNLHEYIYNTCMVKT